MKKYYLFLFACLQISISFAQIFPVGHTTITFNDPSRTGGFGSGGGPGRQIQTEIYYPAVSAGNNTAVAIGEFPVIVFGHGFAMAWDAYQNIWNDFASKGYIIAFPRTEGSLIPAPSHNNFGLDLAIVEVKLQALDNNASSLFYQKVVPKSAIMGHSMGGGATFIAAANNTSPTLLAVVGLAPAETNPSAITAALNVTVDALILSGSSDGVTPPATNHQPIYNNLASTCKTFLSITNGSHCYFANSNFNCDFGELTTGTGSLSRAAQQDITSDYVNLWLAFELKSSCVSWDEFLDSLAVSTRVVEQQSCNYGYLQPTVSITGDSTFCQGGNTILNASQNSSYTYSWFVNNLPISNNADTLIASVSGNYLVSASNAFGCMDSSSIFMLSAIPTYTIQDTVSACVGSTYVFPDGFTSTQNTNHISSLMSSLLCDSTIDRYVFFEQSVSSVENISLCAGTSVSINGTSYSNDTLVSDTLIGGSSLGCDSIVNYNITISLPDSTFANATSCNLANTGVVSVTNPNQFTCDSVHTITTTLLPSDSTFANATSCNPTDTGVVSVTNPNQFTCDSVHTLTTSLASFNSATKNVSGCDSALVLGTWYLSSTNFNDTLIGGSANSCDSITTFNVVVHNSDSTFANATSCNPADTGVVSITNSNQFACDSVHTITTTLMPSDSSFVNAAICQGEDYQLPSGLFVNQAGLYPITNSNQFGCDSVYTINLTVGTPIPPFNVEFFNFNSLQIGDTVFLVLIDTLSYDSLLWTTDGSSSLLSQSGDTAFFVIDSVQAINTITLTVYYEGCSRSQGTDLALVGVRELLQSSKLILYPNPTTNILQISSNEVLQFVQVYNLLGELIVAIDSKEKEITLDCSGLTTGIYFMKTAKGIGRFVKN